MSNQNVKINFLKDYVLYVLEIKIHINYDMYLRIKYFKAIYILKYFAITDPTQQFDTTSCFKLILNPHYPSKIKYLVIILFI